MYSRRDFGKVMIAGLPLSMALGKLGRLGAIDSTVDGVRLGAITYSFNDIPSVAGQDQVDNVIQDCQGAGVGLIELMCNHVEPVTEYAAQQATARAARLAAAAAAAAANPGAPPAARAAARRRCSSEQILAAARARARRIHASGQDVCQGVERRGRRRESIWKRGGREPCAQIDKI